MYIRPLAITGELRKVPKVHILPNWLCRCPEAGHQQQIVCSLTPCRYATTAVGSRSPRRRIATTCSSVTLICACFLPTRRVASQLIEGQKTLGQVTLLGSLQEEHPHECRQCGLQGIVSKKNHSPYKIG